MLQTPCDRMHQIHKLTIKYFPHHFSLHSFRWICSSCCQSNVHADCQGLCQRLDKDGYVQQGTKPLLKCVLKADAVYLFSAALFVSPVLFLLLFPFFFIRTSQSPGVYDLWNLCAYAPTVCVLLRCGTSQRALPPNPNFCPFSHLLHKYVVSNSLIFTERSNVHCLP